MNKLVFLALVLLLAAVITCSEEQVQTKYDEETLDFKGAKDTIRKLVNSVKNEFAKNHFGKIVNNIKIANGGHKALKADDISSEAKELEHFALDAQIQKENLVQENSKPTEFETLALKIDAEIKEPIEKEIKPKKEKPQKEDTEVLDHISMMSSLLDNDNIVLEKEGDEQLEKKEAKTLAREQEMDKKKEKKTPKSEREAEEKGVEEEKTLDAEILGVREEEPVLANEEEVLNGVMKHFSGFENTVKTELISLLKSMKGIKVQEVETQEVPQEASTLKANGGIQESLQRLFKN